MDSSVVTMMHAVRGLFPFAHIDCLVASCPASMPLTGRNKNVCDTSRARGLASNDGRQPANATRVLSPRMTRTSSIRRATPEDG